MKKNITCDIYLFSIILLRFYFVPRYVVLLNLLIFFLRGGGGSSHSREFLTHMETSPLPVKCCSALVTIIQWGFCSVPHLLWDRASVYNGHLRDHVTLTHIAERLAVMLSLPAFTTNVCCNWDSNTQSSAWESQFVLISGFKLLKLKWNNCALVQEHVLFLKPNLSITFLNQKLLESVGC